MRKIGTATVDRLAYQVFFLCRLDFKRLRRLWLFIFKRRFFFKFPMCVIRIKKVKIHK